MFQSVDIPKVFTGKYQVLVTSGTPINHTSGALMNIPKIHPFGSCIHHVQPCTVRGSSRNEPAHQEVPLELLFDLKLKMYYLKITYYEPFISYVFFA